MDHWTWNYLANPSATCACRINGVQRRRQAGRQCLVGLPLFAPLAAAPAFHAAQHCGRRLPGLLRAAPSAFALTTATAATTTTTTFFSKYSH